MDDNLGWAKGSETYNAGQIFETLGEHPTGYHMAERAEPRNFPVRVWYALQAGLLDVRSSQEGEKLVAELTPWSDVEGVRVKIQVEAGKRAKLGVSIESPEINVEPQRQHESAFTAEPNPELRFIEIVRQMAGSHQR